MRRPARVAVAALGALLAPIQVADASPQTLDENGTEFQLADARILSLSPDGKSLAGRKPNGGRATSLCVFDVPSMAERACAELDLDVVSLDDAFVVWSPDSAMIAFAEESLVVGEDGDLWVMDASTGELINRTDDGYEGGLFGDDLAASEGPVHVDLVPAWAPDGRSIAVSRSSTSDGELGGNDIVSVDLDSGAVEQLVAVSPDEFAVVWSSLEWAPDGQRIHYAVDHPDPDHADNGLWTLELSTGETSQTVAADPQKGTPALVDVGANGTTGLVVYPRYLASNSSTDDGFAVVDLESGTVGPIDPTLAEPVVPGIRAVTLSPGGTQVLYWRFDDDAGQLSVRDLPDGKPADIASSAELVQVLNTFGGGLDWASDGTVLTATGLDAGVLMRVDPDAGSNS